MSRVGVTGGKEVREHSRFIKELEGIRDNIEAPPQLLSRLVGIELRQPPLKFVKCFRDRF